MPDLEGLWHVYLGSHIEPVVIEVDRATNDAIQAGETTAWAAFLSIIVWASKPSDS